MYYKKGAGILCYRNIGRNREYLLVSQQFSNEFVRLIIGNYYKDEPINFLEMRSIEIIILIYFDFEKIYNTFFSKGKINDALYKKCLKKFLVLKKNIEGNEKDFIDFLKSKYKNCSNIIKWQIPKGRKNSTMESSISCGLRELREETGINKSDIKFMDTSLYLYENIKYNKKNTYIIKYFLAKILNEKSNNVKNLEINLDDSLNEILVSRWFTIGEINGMTNMDIDPMKKNIINDFDKYLNNLQYLK
jgi:8-oxo-dGTP pyrophosphatase MutT (NUDIX family)